MKRLLLGFAITGVGILTDLQASNIGYYDSCCGPCPSWCCGSFEVGGQWIYLRPTSCDYDFVSKDNRPFDPTSFASIDAIKADLPNGKKFGIDPDYESGFRVSFGYTMDCSCVDVRVEYTHHHHSDNLKVFGAETNCGLWPTYMHPRYSRNVPDSDFPMPNQVFQTPLFSGIADLPMGDFIQALAQSNVQLNYDSVDLQFGNRAMMSCNFWMRTYVGLHFMNLDHRQAAQYNGIAYGAAFDIVGEIDTQVVWNRNTWGIGPLFGIDARYDVACGFGIGSHVRAAILAGETDGRMHEHDVRIWFGSTPAADVDEMLDVCHPHSNILFPYLNASLGVNYLWCCGDYFRAVVEVGYEFSSYINSIGHLRFDDERGTGMANCDSYNLDGIYISVRATL